MSSSLLVLVGLATVVAIAFAAATVAAEARLQPKTAIMALVVGIGAVAWGHHIASVFQYSPRGNEIVYLGMANGEVDAASPTQEFYAALIPRSVAELVSHTPADWRDDDRGWLPESRVVTVWRGANRLALPLWVLAVALVAGRLGGRGAGPVAALLAASMPVALAWSTTAYLVVPAVAGGACALLAGMRGSRGTAAFLATVVLGARPDVAPLVVAAVLYPEGPWLPRRHLERGLAGAAVLVAGLVLVLGDPAGETAGAYWTYNLAALVPSPGEAVAAAGLAILLGAELWTSRQRAGRAALAGCVLLAGLSLLAPMDLGARHLLSGASLVIVLFAASTGTVWWTRGLACVLGVAALTVAFAGQLDLAARLDRSRPGTTRAWEAAADAGGTWPLDKGIDGACTVAFPGNASFPGSDVNDLSAVFVLYDKLARGECIRLVFGSEEMTFSSDCRSEQFDRSRRLLGLRPMGWVVPTTDGTPRWMLWAPPEGSAGAGLSFDGAGESRLR